MKSIDSGLEEVIIILIHLEEKAAIFSRSQEDRNKLNLLRKVAIKVRSELCHAKKPA